MHSSVFCLLMGFVLLSTNFRPTSAGIAELLNNVDNAALMPPTHSFVTNSLKEALEDNNIGTPCHVEYQVTKRATGRCVKLGRNIQACASGTYLDPFHPECM